MINVLTLNKKVETEDMYYIQVFGMTKEEFDEGIREAKEDIANGRVHSLEEMMLGGLEILEKRMPELSKKEQAKAKKFLNKWKKKYEEKI